MSVQMKTRGFVTLSVRHLYPIGFYGPWIRKDFTENLLTNNGRDFYHNQCLTNTAAGTRGANVIAVTQSVITPNAVDTALTGEETANGFPRAQATTITHTNGTNQTTLAITFTANATITSILASALFNATTAPVSGTMTHEANFGTGSGTMISGDQLTVTWTINLG